MKTKLFVWVIILSSSFSVRFLFAQETAFNLSPSGGWTITQDSSDILAAGDDFPSPVASAADLVTINVTTVPAAGWYHVTIERSDTLWHANLLLYARGTANGAAGGGSQAQINWASGLNVYQEITTTPTVFFDGRRTRTGIKIQYEVDGLSVSLPINTYRTTIIYTALDGRP